MNAHEKDELPELTQVASTLDGEFSQLERLSGEISRLDVETDNGFERAQLLLARFSESGNRIGDGIQSLAKSLEDARSRAEAAAKIVSERAELIQKRQETANRLMERFQALGLMANKVSSVVSELQGACNSGISPSDKRTLISRLPELGTQLSVLAEEGSQIRKDALSVNMRKLAGEADSLSQSLLSAQGKIASIVSQSIE